MSVYDYLKSYSVTLPSGKHISVLASDAFDACVRVCSRFGWQRSSYCVDASTRGRLCCEMYVRCGDRDNCFLVAVPRGLV